MPFVCMILKSNLVMIVEENVHLYGSDLAFVRFLSLMSVIYLHNLLDLMRLCMEAIFSRHLKKISPMSIA